MTYSTQFDPLFQQVGSEYNIDPLLLKTIAIKESGINPNVSDNHNSSNGTIDVGLMQINSADPQFNQYGGYTTLKTDPLANIRAAAQTLTGKASMLQHMGQPVNTFNLLHAYNGWSPQGSAYATSAIGIYNSLGGTSDNSQVSGSTTASTGRASSGSGVSGISLLTNPMGIFWLVLGGVILVLGIWVMVNPLANLSNVVSQLGVKSK